MMIQVYILDNVMMYSCFKTEVVPVTNGTDSQLDIIVALKGTYDTIS